jgi:hypothetical protein
MKRKMLFAAVMVMLCLGFSGCDRTAPEVSGVGDTVEVDCDTKLNLENYLNDHLKITDETDDGTVDYKLADLEHEIVCDESIYNSETGDIDTTKPGDYDVELTLQDESNNKTSLSFSLVLQSLKMESTVEDTVEMDCGTEFNILDYLNENITITNQTGDIEYKLDELDYTIDCDDSVYNSETGDYNTEKYGENKVALVLPGDSVEGNNVVFTVKVDPLKMESSIEDLIEIDCGTSFNVLDYIRENVKLSNQAGDKNYDLNDFTYTIDCDDSVYNANTGDFDTAKFGEFPVKFTIDSDCFEKNILSFTVKLNPLVINKGSYVYESDISSSGYDYLGFCEYKNTSSENLKVNSVEFQYFDKDNVMIGSNDMPEYSLDYLKSGASGYALDTFSSYNFAVSSSDEIARVEVFIDYDKATGADTTSLEVGDMEITNSYEFNFSGFAGTVVITNPYDNNAENFSLLAGMYDSDGNLVGVMDSMDSNGIAARSQARCTASWLPDSREIPDKVTSLKASARITSQGER